MDLLWTLYSCCAISCVLYASKLRRFLAIWGYLMPYMDLFDAICVIWWYLICSTNIHMQNDLKCRDKIKINEQLKTGAQLWLFDAIYWSIWVHVALTCASWQCYGLTIIVFAECRHTTKCLPCGLPGTLFCRESWYTHGKHTSVVPSWQDTRRHCPHGKHIWRCLPSCWLPYGFLRVPAHSKASAVS
jgi:hypothetical protein